MSHIIGNETFVAFDKEAEKLFNVSASLLLQKQEWFNFEVPPAIQNLCGKEFVFKIKLNEYNLKEGLENYSISKSLTPDYDLEKDYKKFTADSKDNGKKTTDPQVTHKKNLFQ